MAIALCCINFIIKVAFINKYSNAFERERIEKRGRGILSPSRFYRIKKYSLIYTLFDNEVSKRNIQSIFIYSSFQI